MTQQKFIDRKDELETLNNLYSSENYELVIVYGRRRIGKTEIIKQFVKNKPHIYFLCEKTRMEKNIENFLSKASETFGESFLKEVKVNDWNIAFQMLSEFLKERIVIVFDEFPYLIEIDRNIISTFQKIWDEILSRTRVFLILCGSSIGMMETEVLGYKSPLYGRRTAQIKLKEIEIKYLKEFFPEYGFEDLLKIYGIVGGIPLYLIKFNPSKNLEENLRNHFLERYGFFFEEAENILRMEFREPRNYMLILKAIAEGKRKYGEIVNETGLEKSAVSRYLEILQSINIVDYEIPLLESKKSKKRFYYIKDNYFNFWFRFIYPNKSNIEEGKKEIVMHEILSNFSNYFSTIFEKICEKVLIRKFSLTKIGKQWGKIPHAPEGKNQYEIDIVALNEKNKEILFAECKWQNRVNAEKTCKELAEKARYVEWCNNERKETFAIFAKSFRKKIKKFEGRKVYCFDLQDIENELKK